MLGNNARRKARKLSASVCVLILILFGFSLGLFRCTNPNDADVTGVWSWAELSYHDNDTSYVWNDVDGQIIFTGHHYSFIQVYAARPREILPDFHSGTTYFDKLDKAGLRDVFYPMVAHSGEYKIRGDTILFYRAVALWPNAMDGNFQPKRMPAPSVIGDSLIFIAGPFKNIWVKKR